MIVEAKKSYNLLGCEQGGDLQRLGVQFQHLKATDTEVNTSALAKQMSTELEGDCSCTLGVSQMVGPPFLYFVLFSKDSLSKRVHAHTHTQRTEISLTEFVDISAPFLKKHPHGHI